MDTAGATGSPGRGALTIAPAATAYPPPRLTDDAEYAAHLPTWIAEQATAGAVGVAVPVTATDMVTVTNPMLGLTFAYPREMGEAWFGLDAGGAAGYSWSYRFSRFDALTLQGVSADYENGGAPIASAVGVVPIGQGRYAWRSSRGPPMPLDVQEVLNAGGSEVVVFRPPYANWEGEPRTDELAAIVNLTGKQFPCALVLSYDPRRLPIEALRAILGTIRSGAPTEPGPTPVATP